MQMEPSRYRFCVAVIGAHWHAIEFALVVYFGVSVYWIAHYSFGGYAVAVSHCEKSGRGIDLFVTGARNFTHPLAINFSLKRYPE